MSIIGLRSGEFSCAREGKGVGVGNVGESSFSNCRESMSVDISS